MRLFLVMLFGSLTTVAHATECPAPPPGVAPGCKVVTLNPAEELSLLGQNNILDAAAWARRMELEQVIGYWRRKLQEAPAGDPPAAKSTTPPPAAKQ